MRVTQSMLSNNMLRNLSSSYTKMGKLQEQITTGKKVNRPSDDPVVAMKGMGYRMTVDKIAQYQKNLGEVNNWLDSSDDALDGAGQALLRIQELTTDAANDTKTHDDRMKIVEEIKQIREQIRDMGNTKVGDKYLFSGTKTSSPLFGKDPVTGVVNSIAGASLAVPTLPPNPAVPTGSAVDGFEAVVAIEVFDGIELQVNTNGYKLFSELDEMMGELITSIESNAGGEAIGAHLTSISTSQDAVLTARANIGARQNRVEMMEHRLGQQEGSAKKQMSENEYIDYEKAITDMITEEAIHRAALSVGARIIQPSLVDFLR
ncbi:flagellar hook-associated protein FlgL [Sporosarcina sp. CAU 1771]